MKREKEKGEVSHNKSERLQKRVCVNAYACEFLRVYDFIQLEKIVTLNQKRLFMFSSVVSILLACTNSFAVVLVCVL
jgi:hypothetical protein